MDSTQQTDLISKILPLAATGVVSLIIGICLERFKNRISQIKHTITFQPLATSSQTEPWGEIEVYHNGRKTQHLNFVTIIIENDSNIDHQDVNVDVYCDEQSQFLAHNAFYNENNLTILLEGAHYNYYVDVLTRLQHYTDANKQNKNLILPDPLNKEVQWIQRNKKFHLPVLNRKSKITINLLAENYQAFIPSINVGVLKKSIKLIKASDSETDETKSILWIVGLGLILFIVGIIVLYNHYIESQTPILLTASLGVASSGVGFFIYQIFKSIKRLFT